MDEFKVYALFNAKHRKIYIGQTRNLDDRFDMHVNKIFPNNYTARFDGDWQIIYEENVSNRDEALLRERQLKSYRGREFIKKFIPG